ADDAGFAHEPRTHLVLAVAAALHLGLDASPLPAGLDEAWMDAVDLHAVILAAMRHRLAEGRAGRVDRAADGEGGLRLAAAGASDRDERAAARLQQRPGRAREPHMGEKFKRVAVLPVGVGELEEIAALGGAGIVDEHIKTPEFAPHRLDEDCGRALLAQVDVDDHGLAAL